MLFSTSEGWRRMLDGLLEEHGGRRITRTQFTFHPERFASLGGWRERVPDGFHMRQADRELAQRIPGIAELWGSVDDFLSGGFFLCVMKGDQMVSRSGTVFVGDGRALPAAGVRDAGRLRLHRAMPGDGAAAPVGVLLQSRVGTAGPEARVRGERGSGGQLREDGRRQVAGGFELPRSGTLGHHRNCGPV